MARRITSFTNYVGTTSASRIVSYKADYTVCFWLRVNSLADSVIGPLFSSRLSVGSAYDEFRINRFGSRFWNLHVYDALNTVNDEWYSSGDPFDIGTWYHIALVREGTNLRFYVDQTLTHTIVGSHSGSSDPDECFLGNGGVTTGTAPEYDIEGFKAWTRALTVVELQRESLSVRAVLKDSLFLEFPLIEGDVDGADWASSRDWTETGTIGTTTVEGPRVPFKKPDILVYAPTASAAPPGGSDVSANLSYINLDLLLDNLKNDLGFSIGTNIVSLTTNNLSASLGVNLINENLNLLLDNLRNDLGFNLQANSISLSSTTTNTELGARLTDENLNLVVQSLRSDLGAGLQSNNVTFSEDFDFTATGTSVADFTTVLTTAASNFNVGRQHGHFNIRGTTPVEGLINDRDAHGQWRVVRNGSVIHRIDGVLDFAWLGLDGDIVWVRAVDKAGYKGSWVSYTFSVQDNLSADVVRYLSASGSDSNDGTTNNPWLTIEHSKSQMELLVSSGQVGVLFIAGASSAYNASSSAWGYPSFISSGLTERAIRYVWDGSGSKPSIVFASGVTGFYTGMRESIHIEGINLISLRGDSSSFEGCINMQREDGAISDRRPYNLALINCTLYNWYNGITGEDNLTPTSGLALQNSSGLDFVAFEGTTWSGTYGFDMVGLGHCRYVLMRNLLFTHGDPENYDGAIRIYNISDFYAEDIDTNFVSGTATGYRFCVDSADPLFRRASLVRLRTKSSSPYNTSCRFEFDSGGNGVGDVEDVRFFACNMYPSTFLFVADGGGTASGNAVQANRVDYINCVADSFYIESSNYQNEIHQSIRLRDCGFVRAYRGSAFITLNGVESKYASGCLQVNGCYGYYSDTGNTVEDAMFYYVPDMLVSEFAEKISNSDYNHIGKADLLGTLYWVRSVSGITSESNLSTWQSTYNLDLNSTNRGISGTDTTFYLTNDGLLDPTAINVRLTAASGPLSQSGYPLPNQVSIDADGYIRSSTTPDAGPYEYGANTLPDDPTSSSFNINLSYTALAFTVTNLLNDQTIRLKTSRLKFQ